MSWKRLPFQQLVSILWSGQRKEKALAVKDCGSKLLVITGDLKLLRVRKDFFEGGAVNPNWGRIKIIDHGFSLQLGEDYEASVDAIREYHLRNWITRSDRPWENPENWR